MSIKDYLGKVKVLAISVAGSAFRVAATLGAPTVIGLLLNLTGFGAIVGFVAGVVLLPVTVPLVDHLVALASVEE